jgi:methionyl-tRNA formyltransferase
MQQARDCQRFFENDWRFLDPSIPLLVVPDINAPIVRQRLADIKPDVVLDHGTGIVRDELIESVPLALNVHWGLSPYYRGTHCTEWALVNWDPYNIGVTLHRLSREIDGGGVVSQARAQITPDDTVHSINMQLTQLGTALARGALTRLDQGHQLVFHSQDHAQGLLTLNRQWSRTLTRQMRYIENQGLIGRMLKHPARRARLPIVELAD